MRFPPTAVQAGTPYPGLRRHRADLRPALQELERAVAAPAGGPGWQARVHDHLARLREQLTEHIVTTEGPEGRYAELREYAPRLTRPVAGLVADHRQLLMRVDALARRLRHGAVEPAAVRAGTGELMAAFARHRQRGADLVYEAYATDLGGET